MAKSKIQSNNWKLLTSNTIPSDAQEIKVIASKGSYVVQSVFDTSTFGNDWKWYVVGGYYVTASDNVSAVTQFKQGAINAKLFYVNGSLQQDATFSYYYR